MSGLVVYAFDPSAQKAEQAGRFLQDKLGLQNKILSQAKKPTKEKTDTKF